MKKSTKVAMITLLTSATLMGMSNVKATDVSQGKTTRDTSTSTRTDSEDTTLTWTDVSNSVLSFEIVEPNASGVTKFQQYGIKITGLKKDGHYYVYIANGKAPEVSLELDKEPQGQTILANGENLAKGTGVKVGEYIEKTGDIYVTLVEAQMVGAKWHSKELITGKKVDRPALGKLGTRIGAYFFKDHSSVLLYDPLFYHENKENRKVKIKIGTISDKDILRAIKDKKANSLNSLCDYAKKATSPVYEGTLSGTINNQGEIVSKMNLVNEAYYYVYFVADDENGKYFPVEDVSLYQCIRMDSVGVNKLADYLSADFKWNLDDDGSTSDDNNNNGGNKPTPTPTPAPTKQPDDTTMKDKLPQTGQAVTIGVITGIAVISGAVFFAKSKKYKV